MLYLQAIVSLCFQQRKLRKYTTDALLQQVFLFNATFLLHTTLHARACKYLKKRKTKTEKGTPGRLALNAENGRVSPIMRPLESFVSNITVPRNCRPQHSVRNSDRKCTHINLTRSCRIDPMPARETSASS